MRRGDKLQNECYVLKYNKFRYHMAIMNGRMYLCDCMPGMIIDKQLKICGSIKGRNAVLKGRNNLGRGAVGRSRLSLRRK